MKRLIIFMLISFLVISCSGSDRAADAGDNNERIEEKAEEIDSLSTPDFTLPDLEGNEHTLSDYLGKVIIIDFWATYCKPCRDEIPHFIEFFKEYSDSGLVILGVGVDTEENLKRFSEQMSINYSVLIGDRETAMDYEVKAIPTTFIIDRKGEVIEKFVGYVPGYEENMKEVFVELLRVEDE